MEKHSDSPSLFWKAETPVKFLSASCFVLMEDTKKNKDLKREKEKM